MRADEGRIDYFFEYRRRHPGAAADFFESGDACSPVVISVSGSIDSDTASDFLAATMNLLGSLPRGAVISLDLKDVRFVSSTGVGALTSLLAAAEGRGVALRVSGLSPACEDVFSVLGLLDYLNISGTDAAPAPD